MDAGFQINELVELIGVTQDTVINWEIRGIRPWKKNIRNRIQGFIAENCY